MNKKFNTWGALCGVGVLLTASGFAHAANRVWAAPVSGVWATGSNWVGGVAPQNGDDVFINVAGTYEVTYVPSGSNTDFASLTLGNSSGVQTLSKPAFTLNVTGATTINPNGVFTQTVGNFGGAGTFTVASGGVFNFSGGTITPGGTITNATGGTINLNGNNKVIQRNLVNNGQLDYTDAGLLSLGNGTTLTNNSGFRISSNSMINKLDAGANPIITNSAVLFRFGGGTTNLNGVDLVNNGEVALLDGTLSTNAAYTQNSGLTSFVGGNLFTTEVVNVNGGTVRGSGTLTGSLNNSAGNVSPSPTSGSIGIGTLTVTNNYTQGATGAYNVDIAGPAAGTQYDVLNVGGAATLAGALNNNVTYAPASGAFFQVLNYASRSGSFSPVNTTGTPGVALDTQYNVDNLTLLAATLGATVTVPSDGAYVNAPRVLRGLFTRDPQLGGNTGLASATFTVQEVQTGLYWNGSSFQAAVTTVGPAVIVPATGAFGSNNGPSTPDVTDGFQYRITATATDSNGNSVTSAPVTVRSDKTRPTLTFNNAPPAANALTITALPPSFTGTATDPNGPNGTSSGLRNVTFTLYRFSDQKYWNGTTFQTGFAEVADNSANTSADSGATVNYNAGPTPNPGSNPNVNLIPGDYSLVIASFDKVGNGSGAASATRSFTVVPAAPPMMLRSNPSAKSSSTSPSGGSS